jgi:dynein heavy chain
MSKFVDILEQFSREIDLARDIFETNKALPPLTRNQPPVAGAIKWSRSVFSRVKHTFNALRVMTAEMMEEQVGRDVHDKYMSLAKQMMYFEKQWFNSWSESIDKVAMEHLKQPILREDGEGRISVNFHEDLSHLIRETRYLDRMGFKIPEVALNVTLQEDKYQMCVDGINLMLSSYYSVMDSLNPVERELLSERAKGLRASLNPGFTPLNWNSLGIPDFIGGCNTAIRDFQSLLKQVQKNQGIIDKVVGAIASAATVKEPPSANGEMLDLQVRRLSFSISAKRRPLSV